MMIKFVIVEIKLCSVVDVSNIELVTIEIINNTIYREGEIWERVNGGKFTANSAKVTFCEKKLFKPQRKV